MTAEAPAAPADAAEVADVAAGLDRWRRLTWVTWRQHRAGLVVVFGLIGLTAAYLTVVGVTRWYVVPPRSDITDAHVEEMGFVLSLLPIVAGLVLGAPLLAQESESGTVRFAWTQGVSKSALLVAKAISVGVSLAIGAAVLGLVYTHWAGRSIDGRDYNWADPPFSFHALPYAGWMVFGFSLGLLLGVLTRRTVPALAATFVGYVTVFFLDNWIGRLHYLPPVRLSYPVVANLSFNRLGPSRLGSIVVNDWGSWPDGRPLTQAEYDKSIHWQVAHHVLQWWTYQPGSRFVTFQFLEFGYLTLLSALAVLAAVLVIRRRSA